MDTNTSGEELTTKTRKPYTITKQRERWTEDEHDRFLEALRLYGRAWQRIEEHIGTKTAVQIRSHAQKFFTKLEKEAEAKGIPVCKALDIEIPPPRPKRKPNTPYPRKLGNNGVSSSPVSSTKLLSSASSSHINQQPFLDLEKIPPSSEKTSNGKDTQSTFTESEPTLGKGSGNNENRTVQDVPKKNKDRDGNNDITIQNYLQNHHPSAMMFRPMGKETHGKSNLQDTTTSSTTTSSHHQQQDDYRNFLQMSSTFSNLIISTLLQNPAAHAAATYAASFWPYTNVGDSSSTQNSSSPPSLAAIAAATVAAATAWWASHGLLPLCPPPPPPPFTCVPLPTTVAVPTPTMDTNNQVPLKKQTASKSPASSSGDSEETGVTKINNDSKTNGDKVVADSTMLDSNNGEKKKPVDRSSCGSNTPSGSDAETDALDKTEKDKEDVVAKDVDANQLSIVELSNRRSKIRDNNPATDSWKEVSEEGRIAFQALFARERLPQSFSPPQVAAENPNGKQSENISTTMASVQTTRQTGFKPYKRCSMEVKESQVGNTTNNQSDEKVCKRIRLEGEAST